MAVINIMKNGEKRENMKGVKVKACPYLIELLRRAKEDEKKKN